MIRTGARVPNTNHPYFEGLKALLRGRRWEANPVGGVVLHSTGFETTVQVALEVQFWQRERKLALRFGLSVRLSTLHRQDCCVSLRNEHECSEGAAECQTGWTYGPH
jgi:hypothetical protein